MFIVMNSAGNIFFLPFGFKTEVEHMFVLQLTSKQVKLYKTTYMPAILIPSAGLMYSNLKNTNYLTMPCTFLSKTWQHEMLKGQNTNVYFKKSVLPFNLLSYK